jgi:glyoxylase-like metal-dependent hydrolase (beta-lactamase superfamily II)
MAHGLDAQPVTFAAPQHLRGAASCVTPGVWATAIPFPGFLGHSYCYLMRARSGIIAIDLGWDSDDGWDAFQVGLLRAGASLRDLVGVVVTHAHPDHFGLVDRVRKHTGAWIAGHESERVNVLRTPSAQAQRAEELRTWLEDCGAPTEWRTKLTQDVLTLNASKSGADFDILLEDGQPVPDSDDLLRTWHTPGHTAGHLCFLDESRQLLYSGDHLLPRVTPNVSKRPGSAPDPVASYLASLRAIETLDDRYLVLPGHEWSFDNAADRASEIRDHLRGRLGEVAQALTQGATTAWEVSRTLSWSRPFETLNVRGQRQALGETHAYLHYLAQREDVTVTDDRPQIWSADHPRHGNPVREETPEESRR